MQVQYVDVALLLCGHESWCKSLPMFPVGEKMAGRKMYTVRL